MEKLDRTQATHLDLLDLIVDLDRFRTLQLALGAGLVIYGEDADMVSQALNCVEFFRNESCGKCVPCRLGSQKIVDIAAGLHSRSLSHELSAPTFALVEELQTVMAQTSICSLGASAPTPLLSLLRYFPEDVAKYLPVAK